MSVFGFIVVERDQETGEPIKFWRVTSAEPAMAYRVEKLAEPRAVTAYGEVGELELSDNFTGYIVRIGVRSGWWSARYPKKIDERWGTFEHRDPVYAVEEGVLVGWLTPELSPEDSPSEISEVWLIKYPDRDPKLYLYIYNPFGHYIVAAAKLHLTRIKVVEATRRDAEELMKVRPEMVVNMFMPKVTASRR